MSTILSIYEKNSPTAKQTYSAPSRITKYKTRLAQARYNLRATRMPDLAAMESNIDLTPYKKEPQK